MIPKPRPADSDLQPPPPEDAYFDNVSDAWILSRYADVYTALREPALRQIAADGELLTGADDRTRHAELYAAVQADMARLNSAEWRTHMEAVAQTFITRASHQGRPDLVRDVIHPWSVSVLIRLSGATHANTNQLLSIAGRLFYPAKLPDGTPVSNRWRSFQRRRAQSGLNRMIERKELLLSNSMFAGLTQTLPSFLAKAWLALLQHPEQAARLVAEPELMPGAVEELLRYAGIVHTLYRRAAANVSIGDVEIASGQRVTLKVASANFDAAKFPTARTLDIMRRPTGQLGLGTGPHSCVGTALVRLAAATITPLLLAAHPTFDTTRPFVWTGDNTLRWPLVVPVRFHR